MRNIDRDFSLIRTDRGVRPSGRLWNPAADVYRSPEGWIVKVDLAGVCMEDDRIQPMLGINKELSLQFVLGYSPIEFAATLGHIAEGRIEVAPLVTGRVGVDGVPAAFSELATPDAHAKILVEPWR